MWMLNCVKCRDEQEATDTFTDPNLLQNLQSNHVRNIYSAAYTGMLILPLYRVQYFIICNIIEI